MAPVNPEDYLEHLEAQFLQPEPTTGVFAGDLRFRWLTSSVLLVRGDEVIHRLIAPVIGADYVAGLLSEKAEWLLLPSSRVLRLDFDFAPTLPPLRLVEQSATEFLASLQLPIAASWLVAGQPKQQGWLVDARDGFVFLAEAGSRLPFAVPILRLGWLRLKSVENFAADSRAVEKMGPE